MTTKTLDQHIETSLDIAGGKPRIAGHRIIAKTINYDYSGGMAYSRDFRRKVLAVWNKEGLTIAEAAARFAVGSASVVRWSKNVERKPQGYRRRKIDLEAL